MELQSTYLTGFWKRRWRVVSAVIAGLSAIAMLSSVPALQAFAAIPQEEPVEQEPDIYFPIISTAAHPDPQEQICQSILLRANGTYHTCLLEAEVEAILSGGEPEPSSIESCGTQFAADYAEAQAVGVCGSAENIETISWSIRQSVTETVRSTVDPNACVRQQTVPGDAITCGFGTNLASVDLAKTVEILAPSGVTEDTIIILQLWGGNGGPGDQGSGGLGGPGGYTQVTTTLADLRSAYDSTVAYYWLGRNGEMTNTGAGGSGGVASMLAMINLDQRGVSIQETALAVTGGGGGGGAGRDKKSACGFLQVPNAGVLGGYGGRGGVAIASTEGPSTGAGDKGGARRGGTNVSGYGGDNLMGGAPGDGEGNAMPGGDGIAYYSGWGGNSTLYFALFRNVPAPIKAQDGGGQGGDGGGPGDNAGGGGGGGGWGSGGGGQQGIGFKNDCVSGGGGGGGSYAVRSTRTCANAPMSAPGNPDGSGGYFQILFDLGMCSDDE